MHEQSVVLWASQGGGGSDLIGSEKNRLVHWGDMGDGESPRNRRVMWGREGRFFEEGDVGVVFCLLFVYGLFFKKRAARFRNDSSFSSCSNNSSL